MDYWLDELKHIREKKRTIYHSPLPVKKQRVSQYKYERNGEVRKYSKEEIERYWHQQLMKRGV